MINIDISRFDAIDRQLFPLLVPAIGATEVPSVISQWGL